MRDFISAFKAVPAIVPVAAASADNTALSSAIIDMQGFSSLAFVITTGVLADADATFAVTMTHGDQANLSDGVAVPALEVSGSLTAAGFTFADDSTTRKVGYVGNKRYVRITITPSNNASAAPIAAIALQSNPNGGDYPLA